MSNIFATWEQYIIYLRKSRQDDPRETVEEVLAKHETMLQEYAVREFGHQIPERNIYREVVSGESISEREEIKEVLARISDPDIKGVLVVEPSRLSRGDLTDCGHLIDVLRYSRTQVVTPYMTYDLENKMERKFFQDELLRGNDYLEYTKEILWRGRVAAAKRGCYAVGGPAPFGYKKVKIEKDWTLEIVPEDAELVKMIFEWYTRDNIGQSEIARRLTAMGIPSPTGKKKWGPPSVRGILHNRHYLGLVVFNKIKDTTVIEDGEKVKHRVRQKPEDVIVAKGKHPAIIDEATFEIAVSKVDPRAKVKDNYELKSIAASLLYCGKCGTLMARSKVNYGEDRFFCKEHTPRCYKSVKESEFTRALIACLEGTELPALKMKVQNDEGNAQKVQQRFVTKLQAQLKELQDQEEKLYDLLETNVYTPDMFTRRHTALTSKIAACEEELNNARKSLPKAINFQERIETLERTIGILKDKTASATAKNKALKSIVERIEYYGIPLHESEWGKNSFDIKVFLRL